MENSFKLDDEAGRLSALRRYDVLDTAPEEPFDKLTELVRSVIGVPIAAVSLVDSERQWFKSIAGLSACETSRDVSFCSHAIKLREPMVIPDARLDARFARNPLVTGEPHIRSYLGIPLETPDGYNIGALCAIDFKVRPFPPTEIAILSSFAGLVLNELELRQIAMSDGLTKAMTRRAWIEAAGKEISRCRRYDAEASVIIFDIDHFKQVNDLHGHPAGDDVLRTLTQRCFDALRDSDIIGRIGGEEFAILLPSTDAEGAVLLAERLREAFSGTPVDINGIALRVTASFGISSLTRDIADPAAWLAVADSALYRSKAGGRDRCTLA